MSLSYWSIVQMGRLTELVLVVLVQEYPIINRLPVYLTPQLVLVQQRVLELPLAEQVGLYWSHHRQVLYFVK